MHFSTGAESQKAGGYANSSLRDEAKPLVVKYGQLMTPEQVASELGYSVTYFIKKIGSKKYSHLDWVRSLRPWRAKVGSRYKYRTEAVENLLKARNVL